MGRTCKQAAHGYLTPDDEDTAEPQQRHRAHVHCQATCAFHDALHVEWAAASRTAEAPLLGDSSQHVAST